MLKQNKSSLVARIFLVVLIFLGFIYRLGGLSQNHSFWTDEEHVAIFVRAILERGKPVLANGYTTGLFQPLQYWLGALFAKIFGLNEFALRLPSVVFGILTIWATYVLGEKLFNKRVGLLAAFFITFLRIEILWSRQARPYQALQFLFLLGAYFIYKLVEEKKLKIKYLFAVVTIGVLAALFHGLGIVFFIVLLVNLIFLKPAWLRLKWIAGGLVIVPLVAGAFWPYVSNIISNFGKINNLYFYRVFLWYNYSLFVFLALIGILYLLIEKKKTWFLLSSFLVIQFTIASFLLNQPFTRYLYVVFPFLILIASYGLWSAIEAAKMTNPLKTITVCFLVFFIVGMGWKFALFPKSYYPLNEDMQEIPQVDWKNIYSFISEKLKENPGTILVSNWTDLPIWFLGEGSLDYLIRNETRQDTFTGAKVINNLESFKSLISQKPRGLLIIDSWDNYVPEGVREFAKENLKVELENDRLYPIQPRYWPVAVYSWGLK